jgi:hypothetical protein
VYRSSLPIAEFPACFVECLPADVVDDVHSRVEGRCGNVATDTPGGSGDRRVLAADME